MARAEAWTRRGMALLWDAEALAALAPSPEVRPLRALFALRGGWPNTLPSNNGRAIVAAGLEACLDCLSPDDAEAWVENDLRDLVLSFQEFYEGQAALVLWLPSGRKRVAPNPATDGYCWHGGPPNNRLLPLGRLLWAGAESQATRILAPGRTVDPDGPGWIGLHHSRLS